MNSPHRTTLASLLILVLLPAMAAAEWFPFEIGSERRFVNPSTGDQEIARITTTDEVRGREVYRMENTEVIVGEGSFVYWNYWSVDEQGRLLLHGFKRGTQLDAWGLAYDPPLVFADPEIGSTWSNTSNAYGLESGEFDFTIEDTGNNYGIEQLTLPVGTFDAVVTGRTELLDPILAPAGMRSDIRVSITGRRLGAGAGRLIEEGGINWWVQGIGEVQYAFQSSDNIRGVLTFASVPIEDEHTGTSQLKGQFLKKD